MGRGPFRDFLREVPGFYGSGSEKGGAGIYGSGFSWISFGAWSELKERSAGILRVGIFCRDLVYNPKESCRDISGFRSVPEPTEVPGYSGIFRDFVRCLI